MVGWGEGEVHLDKDTKGEGGRGKGKLSKEENFENKKKRLTKP